MERLPQMTRRKALFALVAIAVLAFALTGCSVKNDTAKKVAASKPKATEETPAATEPASGLYTPKYIPSGDEIAVITTSQGVIRAQLAGKDAPITVGNFIELAQKGFYDGTRFHRYEPNFVIQGGDPNTKGVTDEAFAAAVESGQSGYGTGGPGYFIKGEYTTNPNNHHLDGALGMARSQSPDSGGSQFYFCIGDQSFLDPNYTVFGQTLEGKDVIAKLRAGDTIDSIVIENAVQ